MTEEALTVTTPSPALPRNGGEKMNAKVPAFALAAVLAMAIASVAYANLIRSDAGAGTAGSAAPIPAVTSIDPGLRDSFLVLHQGRSAVAADATARIPALAGPNPIGANPALARRAVAANGDVLYLVPAERGVCVIASSHGSCIGTEWAKRGFGVGVGATAAGIQLSGIVPDGVSAVTLNLADGSSHVAEVNDNVYSVHAKDVGTRSVSFERHGHAVTIPFATQKVDAFAIEMNGSPVRVR
jgi:hypothetical protein